MADYTDYRPGDKVFVRRGFTGVNFRNGPSLEADSRWIKLNPGDFLGSVAEAQGKFVRLALEGKYVWTANGNIEPEILPGETVFALPGKVKAGVFMDAALTQVAIPRLPDVVGVVQRIERTGPGKAVVAVSSRESNVSILYADRSAVIGSRLIIAGIAQAGTTDQKLFTLALQAQKQLDSLSDKKVNVQKAQSVLDAIMKPAKARQLRLASLDGDSGLSLVTARPLAGLDGLAGIGFVPVWVIAVLVIGCLTGVAFVSVETYKYFIADRPHQAAAFDLAKMNKFKKAIANARTQADIDKAFEEHAKDVKDYADDEFEKGKDSEHQGLFDKFGTVLKAGGLMAAAFLGVSWYQDSLKPKSKRR